MPTGVLPFWTLGRPMGYGVLRSDLLAPVAASWGAARSCLGSSTASRFGSTCHLPRLPDPSDGQSGAIIFRTFLALVGTVGVTVQFGLTLGLLIFHGRYRRGEHDGVIRQEMELKKNEIEEWIEQREQATE